MSASSYSVSTDKGKVSLRILENKKQQYGQILIKFSTSEGDLLNALLRRFANEKTLALGTPVNNKIANVVVRGTNSIYYTVPDAKIMNSIALLYAYLMKTKLKDSEINLYIHKKCSYKKLHADLRTFSVLIGGKCISTARKFNSKDKAIERFENVLKTTAVNAKAEEKDIEPKKTSVPSEEVIEDTGDMTGFQKLLFAILLGENDFHFNSAGKIVTCPGCREWIERQLKMYGANLNGKFRAFMQQGGSIASKPSKADTDGSKLKARNANAVAVAKFNIEMMSILYNFEIKLTEINEKSFESLKSDMTGPVTKAVVKKAEPKATKAAPKATAEKK